MMKKNFLTGLIILIPIALTFAIVQFFINLLTDPFLAIIEDTFGENNWLERIYQTLANYNLAVPMSKLFILILLTVTIFTVGFLGRHWTIKPLFEYMDQLAYQIPGFNRIYSALQEAVKALLKPENANFSHAVLAPFPHAKCYAMGFITEECELSPEQQKVTIFVPTTPNLSNGYMLLLNKDQLIYLDLSVEEAFKFIISCGLILPEFKVIAGPKGKQAVPSTDLKTE